MNSDIHEVDLAIQNSYSALQQGNKPGARYWAQRAAWLAPDREDPWLILGAISSPTASLAYLQRALKINPASERARVGLVWAQARVDALARAKLAAASEPATPSRPKARGRNAVLNSVGKGLFGLTGVVVLVAGWLGANWLGWPNQFQVAQGFIPRSTSTEAGPTPSATAAATTAAPTNTAAPTPTATATLAPTLTPTELPSPTPSPTDAIEPTLSEAASMAMEGGAEPAVDLTLTPVPSSGEKRVLVDISEQHLYAYMGDQLIFSFVASTGARGGTLTGTFPILDKIENAYSDPWGFYMPDWLGIYYVGPYLENGIHSLPVLTDGSEIWGNDIGKPITYGCVVLNPQDAKMLYNWVEIGTPVQIQP